MGLDMSIYSRKAEGEKSLREEAYWRKHPDLHGFIVQTFADGVDECQEIPLDASKLEQVIKATREKQLPHTMGFFFGQSFATEEDMPSWEKYNQKLTDATVKDLEKVLASVRRCPDREFFYQASW